MRSLNAKSFLYPSASCAVVERDESSMRPKSRSWHIRQRAEAASMISPYVPAGRSSRRSKEAGPVSTSDPEWRP